MLRSRWNVGTAHLKHRPRFGRPLAEPNKGDSEPSPDSSPIDVELIGHASAERKAIGVQQHSRRLESPSLSRTQTHSIVPVLASPGNSTKTRN
jgi:hypothetical protein